MACAPSKRPSAGATYAAAGVDLAAADAAVERIGKLVSSTTRPGVLGSIGGFGGLFALDTDRYTHPVLVSSTDGVGTKLLVAQAVGRWDTVGIDLVAMCVDDLVCVGAEPLFFLDYVATGRLDPDRLVEVVEGIAAVASASGIVRAHHERWDGGGYPAGRRGEEISLAGRIVAIADVFDALAHERPYKRAWPVDEAVGEVLGQRGRQFDPDLLDVFATLDHAALLRPVRQGERGVGVSPPLPQVRVASHV